MKRYDYNTAVYDDVKEAVKEFIQWNSPNGDPIEYTREIGRDTLENELNDTLWTDDSVTGNGSGSYTFSTYTAEEYICHNLDLLADAIEEFGGNMDVLKDGAEACDVTIRCYLLPQMISRVLDEMEENGYFGGDEE